MNNGEFGMPFLNHQQRRKGSIFEETIIPFFQRSRISYAGPIAVREKISCHWFSSRVKCPCDIHAIFFHAIIFLKSLCSPSVSPASLPSSLLRLIAAAVNGNERLTALKQQQINVWKQRSQRIVNGGWNNNNYNSYRLIETKHNKNNTCQLTVLNYSLKDNAQYK